MIVFSHGWNLIEMTVLVNLIDLYLAISDYSVALELVIESSRFNLRSGNEDRMQKKIKWTGLNQSNEEDIQVLCLGLK